LLWGSVYAALDLVESFREVADGEGVAETTAPFVTLSFAFTSGISVGGGLVGGRVGGQLISGDVLEVLIRDRA
jgi:hypothetical protein